MRQTRQTGANGRSPDFSNRKDTELPSIEVINEIRPSSGTSDCDGDRRVRLIDPVTTKVECFERRKKMGADASWGVENLGLTGFFLHDGFVIVDR